MHRIRRIASSLAATLVAVTFAVPTAGAADVAGVRFEVQPATTAQGATIAALPMNPSSGPVKVALVTSTGSVVPVDGVKITIRLGSNPGGGTLSGATTRPTKQGVASFGDLSIDKPGNGYTLVADAPQFIQVLDEESQPFDVVGAETAVCDGSACSVSPADATTSATITVDPSTPGAVLRASLGTGTLDCDNYDEPASSVLWFDYSGNEPKIVTYTISKGIVNQRLNPGVDHFEVCFGGDQTFTTKDGSAAQLDPSTGLYEGLLPGCDSKRTNPPCVISKNKTHAGDVVLTFKAGPGDPQAH